MRSDNNELITLLAIELAWLLGSWAFSVGVGGSVFGFGRLAAGPLDIQWHNSYFRLSTGYAIFPIFVFVATVVTVARGVLAHFRQVGINVVLALPGLLWGLLVVVLYALLARAQMAEAGPLPS